MKKIDFKEQLSKLTASSKKTSWHKAIIWTVLLCLIIFVCANIYLIFKPLSPEIQITIDDEIKSSDITFDQKTIENIKKRLQIQYTPSPSTGKNPFISF
jgi:hypothetical protein